MLTPVIAPFRLIKPLDQIDQRQNARRNAGQLEPAIACYRKALELKPDHYQAHNNLANAFLAQGRLDEAIAEYRKALEIRPGYAEATRNLEYALRLKSQPK